MKITLTPTTGSAVILADHGRTSPSGFVPSASRKVDVLSFVQGSLALPQNRGNTAKSITFSRTIEYDSYAEAQLAALQLNDTLPTSGTLDIELEDQDTHVEYLDTTLEFSILPLTGVLLTISYTLKTGAINRVYKLSEQV